MANYKPKIFISHSAKDDLARKLLTYLFEGLCNDGFDVFVDREILQGGDGWRAKIKEWIWQCDAAIILLSKDALSSDWVKYEATLLCQRREGNPGNFKLIPIYFPDVTPEIIKQKMDPIQLNEIEGIEIQTLKIDNKEIEKILLKIKQQLAPLLERDCIRNELEEYLNKIIYFNCQNEEVLKEICNSLDINITGSLMIKDLSLLITRALFELPGNIGSERFHKLTKVIKSIKPIIDNNRIKTIINILTPFCWVNPEIAVKIPFIAQCKSTPRVVVWRRRWSLSELMHLYRAYCRTFIRVVKISDSFSGEIKYDLMLIRSSLGSVLCYNPEVTNEEINQRILDLEAKREAVFLVIPAYSIDKDMVFEIIKNWPKLVVFLYDKDIDKSKLNERGLHEIVILEPLLDLEIESIARLEWGDLMIVTGTNQEIIQTGEAFQI